jgi:hypothetical protein
MKKKCLQCEKEFTPSRIGFTTEQKFCGMRCRTRFDAKANYSRHRDEPEYKLRQRANFKRWINKNREHYNEMMRERSKLWQRKKVLKGKRIAKESPTAKGWYYIYDINNKLLGFHHFDKKPFQYQMRERCPGI